MNQTHSPAMQAFMDVVAQQITAKPPQIKPAPPRPAIGSALAPLPQPR